MMASIAHSTMPARRSQRSSSGSSAIQSSADFDRRVLATQLSDKASVVMVGGDRIRAQGVEVLPARQLIPQMFESNSRVEVTPGPQSGRAFVERGDLRMVSRRATRRRPEQIAGGMRKARFVWPAVDRHLREDVIDVYRQVAFLLDHEIDVHVRGVQESANVPIVRIGRQHDHRFSLAELAGNEMTEGVLQDSVA